MTGVRNVVRAWPILLALALGAAAAGLLLWPPPTEPPPGPEVTLDALMRQASALGWECHRTEDYDGPAVVLVDRQKAPDAHPFGILGPGKLCVVETPGEPQAAARAALRPQPCGAWGRLYWEGDAELLKEIATKMPDVK